MRVRKKKVRVIGPKCLGLSWKQVGLELTGELAPLKSNFKQRGRESNFTQLGGKKALQLAGFKDDLSLTSLFYKETEAQ